MSAQDLEQRAHEVEWATRSLRELWEQSNKGWEAQGAAKQLESFIVAALRQQPAPVDLEQFRSPVEAWKSRLDPNDDDESEAYDEADRLLSIIDNAGRVGDPILATQTFARAYKAEVPNAELTVHGVDAGLRAVGHQSAPVEIRVNFPQVGTAGPFPVVDGTVTLPDVTMNDLIQHARTGYVQQPAPVVDDAMRELIEAAKKAQAMMAMPERIEPRHRQELCDAISRCIVVPDPRIARAQGVQS